jgi:hypothetical protein
MDTLTIALVAGLAFAVIDLLFMLPVKFKSQSLKREAMMIVFIQRFATGFVIPYISLPVNHALTGALTAFVLSLPLAIYLKRNIPLMGAVIGFIVGWFT